MHYRDKSTKVVWLLPLCESVSTEEKELALPGDLRKGLCNEVNKG